MPGVNKNQLKVKERSDMLNTAAGLIAMDFPDQNSPWDYAHYATIEEACGDSCKIDCTRKVNGKLMRRFEFGDGSAILVDEKMWAIELSIRPWHIALHSRA